MIKSIEFIEKRLYITKDGDDNTPGDVHDSIEEVVSCLEEFAEAKVREKLTELNIDNQFKQFKNNLFVIRIENGDELETFRDFIEINDLDSIIGFTDELDKDDNWNGSSGFALYDIITNQGVVSHTNYNLPIITVDTLILKKEN